MSPFLVISTADEDGKADLSPRGDPPGFVHVVDDSTILIPDRPGNNRLDTMSNIVANPNVGCLFFIPGFEDTLRLNGKAAITEDAELLKHCVVNGKAPKVGILITVEEVFMHCAKALKRSKLWTGEYTQDRSQMPSIARIILEQTEASVDEGEARSVDESVEADYKTGLY
jgi:PPOX class probable FMN-dependent enzyme